MAYDTKPTAGYVRDFARRMEAQYQRQTLVDKEVMKLEAMQQFIAAAKTPNSPGPGHSLRSGIWNQLVRRDAAIATIEPYVRFSPPNPQDEADRRHSSLLEAWANSALKKSGLTVTVRELMARSLIGYGRCWTHLCYDPRVWGDSDMNDATDRLLEDPGNTEIRKEIEAYKRDRWPFRLRYVDPIGTFSYSFNGTRHLPEVIEIRKMTAEAIRSEYGIDVEGDSRTEIEVFQYANWEWEATVVGRDNPQMAREPWEHDLGKNPYTLEESNLMPVNQYGIRWFPALFHAKEMIEAFDEALSDWRTNTHENAIGIMVQSYDPDHYELTPEMLGRPEVVPMEPGGTIAKWNTDTFDLAPTPTLTREHGEFRQFLYSFIEQNAIQPILQGETKSGDSQTLIAGAVGLAERKFSPAISAIKAGQEDRVVTLLRGVGALNRDYPAIPDKVWIFDSFKGKGAIGIGPKDVIGWENAIQARGEPAIPLDEHRKWSIAQIKIGLGIPETQVFEEAGYEDPEAIVRLGMKEKGRRAVFEQVVLPTIIQRATAKATEPTPAQASQLAGMGPGSPGLEAFMAQMNAGAPEVPPGMPPDAGMPPGTGGNGNLLQAASNIARAGVPQTPQVPM